jgi:hypothetical protein
LVGLTSPPVTHPCMCVRQFAACTAHLPNSGRGGHSLGLSLNRKRILSAGPYLRSAYSPQSKGVGQWQLKHAIQGEFAAKKYYEIILDHFSTPSSAAGVAMSCSLCWQLMRASAWMGAQTGVEPADQSCLGKIYQCSGNHEIPRFRPTAPDIAQAPPRLPLRISEFLPATAPRAARGRADAAEAAGCTVVATAKLAPLSLKIYPPPPQFLSNNMFLVKKIRPLANHADFVSGRFLA